MVIKSKTGLANRQSKRSFITINIPFEIARNIIQVTKPLMSEARNFRFVSVDQLHLTLQFLGDDISASSIEEVKQVLLSTILQVKSPLITTGAMHFGHKSQTIPTVLYLEVLPTEEVQNLTKIIHYSLKSLGLSDIRREKDYKKLIYHITLGRAKHHVSRSFGRKINQIIEKIQVPEFSFHPEKLHILNSQYTIKGHKYSELASFKFNG